MSAASVPLDGLLADLLAEDARHRAAVDAIRERSGRRDVPAHWAATAIDLPSFFQWLEKEGLIVQAPECFSMAELEDMLRAEYLSGTPDPGGRTGTYRASAIRDRLLSSNQFPAEKMARISRPHLFKKQLEELAEQSEFVADAGAGKFAFVWPEQRALAFLRSGYDECLFLHYLLRAHYLSASQNESGFVGPLTAEVIRQDLLNAGRFSDQLKAKIPQAERVQSWLMDLSQVGRKLGVIAYRDYTFSIYWPEAYQQQLKELVHGQKS